jgi:hypothetical protein
MVMRHLQYAPGEYMTNQKIQAEDLYGLGSLRRSNKQEKTGCNFWMIFANTTLR